MVWPQLAKYTWFPRLLWFQVFLLLPISVAFLEVFGLTPKGRNRTSPSLVFHKLSREQSEKWLWGRCSSGSSGQLNWTRKDSMEQNRHALHESLIFPTMPCWWMLDDSQICPETVAALSASDGIVKLFGGSLPSCFCQTDSSWIHVLHMTVQ